MSARTTSAPGKLVLAGEYAVLAGHAGLSLAVGRRAYAHSTLSPTRQISGLGMGPFELAIEGQKIKIEGQGHKSLGLARAVFEQALHMGLELPLAHIQLDSSKLYHDLKGAKVKLGLGSSAAIATCLAAQIASPARLFELAFNAHRRFSKQKGSGIDVATSCYGGLIRFEPSQSADLPRVLPVQAGIDPQAILCVFSGKAQNTRSFVKAVQDWAENDAVSYAHLMQDLGDITRNLEPLLCAPQTDFATLARLIEHNVALLDELGRHARISPITDAHREVIRLARVFGGSAKPSGAGGGDVAICFIPPERKQALQRALEEHDFMLLGLELFAPGAS